MKVWDKKWSYEQIEYLNLLEMDIIAERYDILYDDACRMITKFGLKRTYLIDEGKNKTIKWIKFIMDAKPLALSDLSEDKLFEIKKFTILTKILGLSNRVNIPFIPKDYDTGIKYNYRVCMRLLSHYVNQKEKLSKISKNDVVLLTVSAGCSNNPCDYYNTMYKNKKFEVKDVPEIPCSECPLDTGCWCSLDVRYL